MGMIKKLVILFFLSSLMISCSGGGSDLDSKQTFNEDELTEQESESNPENNSNAEQNNQADGSVSLLPPGNEDPEDPDGEGEDDPESEDPLLNI